MVASWTFEVPVTKAGYYDLPGEITDLIDAELATRLYGGAVDDRFLASMKALTDRSNSSNPSETTTGPGGTTSTTP